MRRVNHLNVQAQLLIGLGALFVTLGAPIGLFLWDEWKRQRLIKSYQPPLDLIKQMTEEGTHNLAKLIKGHENLVCSMGSYGRADNLSSLTPLQRSSVPKDKIPSEDGAWYLMFFSTDGVRRIYLIPLPGAGGVNFIDGKCADSESTFTVSNKPATTGEMQSEFSLNQRRK